MAEDFDKVMRQQQDTRAKAEACSYDGTGHSATVTGPRPESLHLHQPSPSSLITSPTDSSQATTSMARPLGRTQTLAHIEITESSNNIPVLDAFGVVAPSSSVLQHRENSDVDDQNHNQGSGTRIDDGGDDAIQTTVGSQHISMVEPLNVQQSASSPTRALTFSPSRTKLAVASTAMTNTHRFPSPASTVPEDPDPEYIFNQLAKHHIKIHDFAQCPPYTAVASLPSHFTDGVSTPALRYESTPNIHPTSVPTILFTSETFDPRKALGEFELRLRQTPRTLPIPGKIIRRLIEIGWVTENEVESRCSESDLKGLEDFDARNRMRLLKLTALREQREKQLGTATPTSGPIIPAVSNSKDLKPGTGLPINEGYTYTGAYPYVTLRSESVPKFAERDELVQALRPHFNITDRVIRMGLAMERERERDRQEAEDALIKVRREEEEAERKRVECEVLALNADKDEEMSNSDALTTDRTVAEIASISPQAVNPRKRSPHDAWADEENYSEDSNDESEVKRSRLARLQSETWYEQRRQQQQSPSGRFRDSQPHPHPQSQRKGTTASSESHNTSNLQSQSQLRNQNQTPLFTPPEIQYPAPLSTYDPNLYPDAANAIEAQSQQSESQGRRHPHSYRPGSDTPLASGDEGDDEKGRKGITAGRGFGLTEDGEPDMNRPNALKRSPKKGVNRELTRGRTLVQIC